MRSSLDDIRELFDVVIKTTHMIIENMATEVLSSSSASKPQSNGNTRSKAESRHRTYPSSEGSITFVNYFRDSKNAPPTTLNSQLSEHEMRQYRRSDDSPHVTQRTVFVRNIRGRESEYSLDKQGFVVSHLESLNQNWRDEAELRRVYFPEVTDLLTRVTGAKYVFQYEYHVRMGTLEEALKTDSTGAVDINGPLRRVHIDESPATVWDEFEYWLRPNDPGNEHFKNREIGVYNVWKPIKTVLRDPLCICDVRTIQDDDLEPGKVTVPHVGEIENFAVKPPREEGAHKFAYLRGQQPHEVLVFRIFDSRIDKPGSAKRSYGAAHTSFVDPGTEYEPSRESIEVRNFCVF